MTRYYKLNLREGLYQEISFAITTIRLCCCLWKDVSIPQEDPWCKLKRDKGKKWICKECGEKTDDVIKSKK